MTDFSVAGYITHPPPMKRIAFEAVAVGAIFGVFMLLASLFVRLNTPLAVALAGFVAGALGHLAFEALGANAWYCTHGVACKAN